jgi:hypothetical protein
MSDFDQNFNRFLTVENPKLAVYGQKLSVAILKVQRVKPFPFLILIKHSHEVIHADAARAHTAQAKAAGWVTLAPAKKSQGHLSERSGTHYKRRKKRKQEASRGRKQKKFSLPERS